MGPNQPGPASSITMQSGSTQSRNSSRPNFRCCDYKPSSTNFILIINIIPKTVNTNYRLKGSIIHFWQVFIFSIFLVCESEISLEFRQRIWVKIMNESLNDSFPSNTTQLISIKPLPITAFKQSNLGGVAGI